MKKIRRPLTLEAVTIHRKETCLHYESCLDQASALLWPSFSCEGCPNYVKAAGSEGMCYEKAASPLAWEV
ncbi:MAG: hypothetical protein QNJ97_05315 [Myxococcota bacterium]|nr:hypothetical protein [Myxococcota bacterium]